jgi:MFS transporter, FHS family, glucose/mannose:H+ symporter
MIASRRGGTGDTGDTVRLLTIAALSMASFGIVMTSLGASLQTVIARYGIDKAQAGALLSLLSFWILAGSLVFGPVVDRRGYRTMLLLSFAAIVAGLETIAFAPSLVWLRAGVVVIGFAGGLVNGAANALVAEIGGERRGAALTFVGAFFGIGAVGVPLVLSSLSGTFSTSALVATIPAFIALPFALTALSSFPPPKQPHGFPVADARRLLHDPVLLLMGLMLFLESGMEQTVGGWAAILFGEELNVSAERAPMYLALFWLGLMLTRLVLGFVLRSVEGARVLFASVAVALVSSLVLVSTHNVGAAAGAIFLLGAGFAAMFPVVFGFVGDRYATLSGTALSLVIAMALVGGMLMPYAGGVLGGAYGLRVTFLLVPISLVLLFLFLGILVRRLGRVATPLPAANEFMA